jgi:hypothetical protein
MVVGDRRHTHLREAPAVTGPLVEPKSRSVIPLRVKAFASYHNSRLAAVEAKVNGHDWPVFLNDQQKVTKGPGSLRRYGTRWCSDHPTIVVASRWRSACRRPTPTTRCCWNPWWTPCRRSRARVGGPADRASVPPSCTATRATTTRAAGGHCADVGSRPGSPGAASSPASGLADRYVVERSLAWLVGYRRLQVRYERRADILLGFVHLACALICLKLVNQSTP